MQRIPSASSSLIDTSNLKDLKVLEDLHVQSDAITKNEHETLINECERSSRRRYERLDIGTGVIESFRKITKRDWTVESRKVLRDLLNQMQFRNWD